MQLFDPSVVGAIAWMGVAALMVLSGLATRQLELRPDGRRRPRRRRPSTLGGKR